MQWQRGRENLYFHPVEPLRSNCGRPSLGLAQIFFRSPKAQQWKGRLRKAIAPLSSTQFDPPSCSGSAINAVGRRTLASRANASRLYGVRSELPTTSPAFETGDYSLANFRSWNTPLNMICFLASLEQEQGKIRSLSAEREDPQPSPRKVLATAPSIFVERQHENIQQAPMRVHSLEGCSCGKQDHKFLRGSRGPFGPCRAVNAGPSM